MTRLLLGISGIAAMVTSIYEWFQEHSIASGVWFCGVLLAFILINLEERNGE